MIAGVESDDPSSTTTSSQSGKVWLRTESIVAARYRSRLNAGRTIETVGPAMGRRRSGARRDVLTGSGGELLQLPEDRFHARRPGGLAVAQIQVPQQVMHEQAAKVAGEVRPCPDRGRDAGLHVLRRRRPSPVGH